MQPLQIPNQVWADICMDFIEGLPLSKSYSVIIVIVDRLSKYSHFILITHPYTATITTRAFMDNIFKLHGIPHSIVSTQDAIFTSKLW